MRGTSVATGQAVSGVDHLRQSVADILTTPIGSRVMRRDYGSDLPALIDQPDNAATQVRVYAAAATALMRWEPRLRLQKLRASRNRAGQLVLDVQGQYLDEGRAVTLEPIPLG